METAPLKIFATWARTALIREVTARIAVVLAPASSERVEQPKTVGALENAVRAAGGGDKGKAALADRVAYTWFNRIIALRFMDANGYTGVGVVSPHAGVENGQPEILSEVKRGNIDTAIVGPDTRETVAALLNGTRRSDDTQGEAYALLLADYCRYWNRAMPFMFEREGDFTELLIPANLLADDSVPSRAVKVLTTEVCQDVEVIGWLYQFYVSERKDEVFAGFKKNKKAGADEIPAATQLFTPHWIVRYLVENSVGRLWMLNRPSSRLVDQMEYYIAPVDEETGFLKISGPEELKVIDPACGSGHMLTYAFDLLCAIYEEEGYAPAEIPGLILSNNLYGVEIDPRAGALAAFALTMKARAKQRTFFAKQVRPNVCVLDPISFSSDELDLLSTGSDRHAEEAFWNQFEHADIFGSLIKPRRELVKSFKRDLDTNEPEDGDLLAYDLVVRARRVLTQARYLSEQYDVVVANPPYMGLKNMSPQLAMWLKSEYADVKADLFSAFFFRCLDLAKERGQLGFMSPFVWMFISSYQKVRDRFIADETITSLIQLEYSGFDGATVPICTFTLQKGHLQHSAPYIRLSDFVGSHQQSSRALEVIRASAAVERGSEPAESDMARHLYRVSSDAFHAIPGTPIVYWLSEPLRAVFVKGRPLGEVAEPRVGLQTGVNARFVRQWWEVSQSRSAFGCTDRSSAQRSGARWFPYNKGGDFRKWWGNQEHVVNWEDDGREIAAFKPSAVIRNPGYYFQPSASWSKISSADPAFREYPPGFVFDVAGTSVFSNDEAKRKAIMGFCNSSTALELLKATAPTLNFEVGTIAGLPIVPGQSAEQLDTVAKLVGLARDDWNQFETSWDFASSPIISGASSLAEAVAAYTAQCEEVSHRAQDLEQQNNEQTAKLYGLEGEVETATHPDRVSLGRNIEFVYSRSLTLADRRARFTQDLVQEIVSFSVGCMFGRYSLDKPGLILADQGATVQDYLAKVPTPSFPPDADNVVPIVDGDWFDDDIVARFRRFLRAAFGEQHFEENLRFVTQSLGVSNLRDYFVKSFYKDHVQRYKKRPIYWLFSSPKGSFNALIYMHRYTPSTVSTVLNEYLREFQAKLSSSLQQQEALAAGSGKPREQAAAQKEADRLRKVLLELEEYEHDVLYPLASRQLAIDLDDGVKANYPKFGAALKKIVGLEASDE
jgi:hypothetical protein